MDSLYAWLHRTQAYGAFLRHCLWAIAPAHRPWFPRQLAVLRILLLALVWGVLPIALLLGPVWLAMAALGIADETRRLVTGALVLGVAMAFAPIILRTLLMPLAWFPAMMSPKRGSSGPATRVYDEMQQQYRDWIETHG